MLKLDKLCKSTGFFIPFDMFKSGMLTVRTKQYQIFYSIIEPIMVNVMNNLFLSKIPFYGLFHNKSMFYYISILSTIRMGRIVYIPITADYDRSTSPLRIVGSSFLITLSRAVKFISPLLGFINTTTGFTSSFNYHIIKYRYRSIQSQC